MINLAVFALSVLAIGVGVANVYGLPWAFIVVGSVLAATTFIISMIPDRRQKNESN